MNRIRLHIVLLGLLLANVVCGQSSSEALNQLITFNANSISKASLLDSLSVRYKLHFSYNPELVDAEHRVDCDFMNVPLYQALNNIVDRDFVDFKAIENQIIFFPIQEDESAEILLPFKVIRGKIIDVKKSEAIPYCNIGIVGKAMGTMSNGSGEFVVKVPQNYFADTLIFSCMGFEANYLPIHELNDDALTIQLKKKTYRLQAINVVRYDPEQVLNFVDEKLSINYDSDYSLFTTFYREVVKENGEFTDVSEAVLQVMKAPYSNSFKKDHVKFLKGRKGAVEHPLSDIRFRLQGGPYFIMRIDVVKNKESFLNPEFRHLYDYKFEGMKLIDDREAVVLSFAPMATLRDILFKGKIYVDIHTWGISRIEFEYTKQGLKDTRHSLIQKTPRNCRAIPTNLGYQVQYKLVNGKWYMFSAMSDMKVKIVDRKRRQKTEFKSMAEILTTNIEKGDFRHFTKQEIFRSNEIFTDKIVSYDQLFWKNYNLIRPEKRLTEALKNFDNQNLVITNLD